MAKSATTPPKAVLDRPREARAYFESRYGQLHVHNAIPAGGGFDEQTTLICLHHSPASGRVFRQFAKIAARTRSVYCPDTPGFGESDGPPRAPSVADYAGAIADFIDLMRFRQVDVLGYRTGSAIAAELALLLPKVVKRLVFVTVPMLVQSERDAFKQSPWPVPPADDGSHLTTEWRRSQELRGPGMSLELMAAGFAEKLYNGPNAWWGAKAVVDWPAAERLPLVQQPALVIRPKDDLWDATARARSVLKTAQFIDLPNYGAGVFEVAPDVLATKALGFLQG